MPYQPRCHFRTPDDESSPIWRYLDLVAFLSILHRQELWFTRVSDLQSKDPFEGSLSARTIKCFENDAEALLKELIPYANDTHDLEQRIRSSFQARREIASSIPNVCAVNCWHLSAHESAAMWNIYGTQKYPIAIRSTFGKLCQSFHLCPDPVFVGLVTYVDYDQVAIPCGNLFHPLLHKRKSFEFENELRALVYKFPEEWRSDGAVLTRENQPNVFNGCGIYVRCDLDILIEKVFIGPFVEKWVSETIRAILSRLKIDQRLVFQSSLDERGIF